MTIIEIEVGEDFDPGCPSSCRCGRVVDLHDMFEEHVDGPLICRQCYEQLRGEE